MRVVCLTTTWMLRAQVSRGISGQSSDGMLVSGSHQGREFDVQRPSGDAAFVHVAAAQRKADAASPPPKVVSCTGRDSSGNVCGADAKVRRVHYKYSAKLDSRLGEMQQVLSEIEYEVSCPRCGWRMQPERSSGV